MKSHVLLGIGIGMVIVACAAFTIYRYMNNWVPPVNTMQTLDAEMDHVQWQMEAWGGADWSARRYSDNNVSQTWFVKVSQLSDHELANKIYDLGGYDMISGRKDGLRMSVAISSAPSSEWRIAHVEIAVVR